MLGDLAYWIPDEEHAWLKADLISIDKDTHEVTVKDPRKKDTPVTYKQSEVHSFDVSHDANFADLCKMNDLHEAPLLNLLKRRYMDDQIYTTAGSMILVSVNPYKLIPGLYDDPLKYFDLPEEDEELSDAMPPHVYKVANQTLHSMLSFQEGAASSTANNFGERLMNQSIIVSGESGAGKTEASKKVMNFLVQANIQLVKPLENAPAPTSRRGSVNMRNDALGAVAHKIQEEILGSNFIFESFGNAKTVRNDNSSRFGKYIKLQYSSADLLVSAYTDTFLLEKSRLLSVAQGESNYHVLYMLVAAAATGEGLSAELADKLKLKCSSPEEGFKMFGLLTAPDGESYWKSDESGQEFNLSALATSLDATGFTKEEQENLWTLLAVILHLGNVELLGGEDGENTSLTCKSMPIEHMADLLGLENATFQEKMTIQLVQARGRSSVATKKLNRKETRNNVNAYIKMVYSSIFNYIVHKINYSHSLLAGMAKLKAEKFIGILDIFGFEIMKKNSFEQLCINYANERLQQHFNKNVFVKEKEEYAAQGLNADFITFADNQDVIDLIISRNNGLFTLMNDMAKINKTDDFIFLQKSQKSHVPERGQPPFPEGSPSARYEMNAVTKLTEFRVRHFAGTVPYTVGAPDEPEASFLMKNNDSLQEGLEQTVLLSSNKFFNNVGGLEIGLEGIGEAGQPGFVPVFANTGMNGSKEGEGDERSRATSRKMMASATTVSSTFMTQVEDLMRVLRETEPHYIKCMKPNTKKAVCDYDGQLMLQQLRYSGVLEVVRIRREGYPWNAPFASFYATFDLLSVHHQLRDNWPNPLVLKNQTDAEEVAKGYCLKVLDEWFPSEEQKALYAVGNTRIYMKEQGFQQLQIEMTHVLDRVSTVIQKNYRMRKEVKWLAGTKRWVALHQRMARGKVNRVWFGIKLEKKRSDDARIAADKKEAEEEAARQEAERKRLEDIARAKEAAEAAEIARLEAEAEAARLAEEERLRIIAEEEERKRLAAIAAEEERLRLIEEEKKRRVDFHAACLHGDLTTVKVMLEAHPELLKSVHPDDTTFKRLPFAKACASRCLPLVQFFNPSPTEVFKMDAAGMNALHMVALGPELAEGDKVVGTPDVLTCMQYLLRAASDDFPLEEAFGVMSVSGARAAKEHDTTIMAANRKGSGPTGCIMKEGYLSKKHESFWSTTDASKPNAWVKRWIRLTDEAIYYFRSEEDATSGVPRDTVSFTKNMGKMKVDYFRGAGNLPAVCIEFSTASGLKGRTVLNLMASDQKDMDEWSRPLKQLSGQINGEFTPDQAIVNMSRLGANESKTLLYSNNKPGNQCLHILAFQLPQVNDNTGRAGASPDASNETTQLVTAMAWLVSCGCYIDERSAFLADGSPSPKGPRTGATPIEIALYRGNFLAAVALTKLGASITPCSIDYVNFNIGNGIFNRNKEPLEVLKAASYVYKSALTVGRPPTKPTAPVIKALANYQRNLYVPKYSYLTVHFQKMVLNQEASWSSEVNPTVRYLPCLKVSLLDRQREMVEHYSTLTLPLMQHRPMEVSDVDAKGLNATQKFIWWGKSVQVETPLDYLPDGCNFVFEYKKDHDTFSTMNIQASAMFTLKFEELRTSGGCITLPLIKGKEKVGTIDIEVVISTLK